MPDSSTPEVGQAPAAILDELRACQRDGQLIDVQRQLLEARSENVALRKAFALRELGRAVGLSGKLRLDLESGRVDVMPESSEANRG